MLLFFIGSLEGLSTFQTWVEILHLAQLFIALIAQFGVALGGDEESLTFAHHYFKVFAALGTSTS